MIFEATNCHRAYVAKGVSLATDSILAVIDFKDMPMGSVQIVWTDISAPGAIDCSFKFFASNLPDPSSFDPDGTEIDGAEIIPHANTGSRIWIRDRIAFRYLLIRFAAGSVAGGTADVIAIGKKS